MRVAPGPAELRSQLASGDPLGVGAVVWPYVAGVLAMGRVHAVVRFGLSLGLEVEHTEIPGGRWVRSGTVTARGRRRDLALWVEALAVVYGWDEVER